MFRKKSKKNDEGDEFSWLHIYPEKDKYPHYTGKVPEDRVFWQLAFFTREKEPVYNSEICLCRPIVDLDDKLIVHNAWDCREAVEEAEAILKET